MKPYAAPPDKFKLNMFPFSLTDVAKIWFLSLPSASIHEWDHMQRKFLEKFYPVGKANQVRRELTMFRQKPTESMYDYVERFTGLEQSCCNLGIPENLLVDYLLDGMRSLERMMLDAAASGSIMNLSPSQVRELIRETAESARFTDKISSSQVNSRIRNVSQVDAGGNQMADEMKEMRETIQMLVTHVAGVKACELCELTDHRTEECPSMQSNEMVDVNAIGGFEQFNNRKTRYGLAVNGYSWKHRGFPNNQGQNQQQQPYQPQQI